MVEPNLEKCFVWNSWTLFSITEQKSWHISMSERKATKSWHISTSESKVLFMKRMKVLMIGVKPLYTDYSGFH